MLTREAAIPMKYKKPNLLCYRIAQAVSILVSKLIFKCKIIRNEIKGTDGPFVVVANHEASLDFVNLIGLTSRPMTFVISNSFYSTLPIKDFLKEMGVIPKQQFQTSISDMKAIRAVVEAGQPLVIYPAGLMCEDGLSTPIPEATYKFLKWLKADVYAAKTVGSYFVMPKWSKKLRPGRTYMDVYKLFSKEELKNATVGEIKKKTEDALLFDAYREQDELCVEYSNVSDIGGLENVLYMCPVCKTEFSIKQKNKNTLHCTKCGFEQHFDKFGFMHNDSDKANEIRYVSDWSKLIYNTLREKMSHGCKTVLSSKADIHMIDYRKNRFVSVGSGTVTLSQNGFCIKGTINGEDTEFTASITNVPSLPFSPGKYIEIQKGKDIYRCVLENGELVMKFINMVKIFYEFEREHALLEDHAAQ